MKPSILQLIDEQPLRLVALEEPKTAPPPIPSLECRRAESTASGEPHGLRSVLLSILLFLLTWLACLEFLG